jgi:hypothetical protein
METQTTQNRPKHGLVESVVEELESSPRSDFRETLQHLFHALEDHVRKDPYGALKEAATFGASLAAMTGQQFREETTRFVKELINQNQTSTEEKDTHEDPAA